MMKKPKTNPQPQAWLEAGKDGTKPGSKLDMFRKFYHLERMECADSLLKGIPEEGGCADKAMWIRMVQMAFDGGIAAAAKRPVGMDVDRLRLLKIVGIIEGIENRCMAMDGPVGNTKAEMTEDELRQIYRLAKGEGR